mmetsp:Transcript_60399/g.67547  ORF Transcript_60399/g.67547 Transcript_60399/m.67547 type:complete len:91 (+) Transcript_60399:565-837(+)
MKNKRVGDHGTYYLHYLRFYIHKRARQTWETHECGIGIYSMQGFERKNKESKNCMKKLITISNIEYHKVCIVFGIYSSAKKEETQKEEEK